MKKIVEKIKIERNIVYIITFFAIAIRFMWIYLVPNKPVSDFSTYQEIASNIFHGKGCTYLGSPTAFQSMGYPILLGCFYKIIGSTNILYGKLLNVIISSATLPIVYLILKKCIKDKRSRVLAFFLIAFLPSYIAYTNVLASENVMVLLFAIIILIQLSIGDSIKGYILFGVVIGIETLIKPYFIAYPLLAAVAYFLSKRKFKDSIKFLSVSFITVCIVISPWTFRNYKNFHRFIPVSYNSGYVLFINNNSNNKNGAWMPIRNIRLSEKVVAEMKDNGLIHGCAQNEEMESVIKKPSLEPVFKREAQKWIWNNKKAFISLGIKRVKNTFFSGTYDINNWCYNSEKENKIISYLRNSFLINKCNFIFTTTLSITGLIFSIYYFFIKKNKLYVNCIFSINVMFFFLMHFVYEGQSRYNYPVLFILVTVFIEVINSLHEKMLK